jgi:nuclear RNA export factor
LASISKRIGAIKGFKLLVKVRPGLPHMQINTTVKEKIKLAMVKHYNADLKALDLSQFQTDPDLSDNYGVTLFRPSMILAVLDIIVENVPELTALDLFDNKLYALDNLSVLSVKFPKLKSPSYCKKPDT